MTSTSANPAENLVGTKLEGGWEIVSLLPKPGTDGAEDLTGSFFSFGYIAANGKTEAFLKVIDVEKALLHNPVKGTLIERMKPITDSYTFECSILEFCERARLDRIVRVIQKGEIPAPPGSVLPIPFILFEKADGDVRKIVSRSSKLDDAWRLSVLHNAAVGLQQLHGQKIAHQDLKPSNVLIFDEAKKGAKIGDLGRASQMGVAAAHDQLGMPGAPGYAPPEQVFGHSPADWVDLREACDLYHLGTLLSYMFAGITPTDCYVANIGKDLRPFVWGGEGKLDYDTALPLLSSLFATFIQAAQRDFPDWARDELSAILIHACHPDYKQRGDPAARARAGRPLGMEMFVSRFDRLSKRAGVELRK